MSRSTIGRIREAVGETKNDENATPTTVTSTYRSGAIKRKPSAKKRYPLGELKKSELDSSYNTRDAPLKLNKGLQPSCDSHVKTVKTVEKRKITRNKKGVCTSVKTTHKTVSTVNLNFTLIDESDTGEKNQGAIKNNDFVTELFKNVTKRQLFSNSPCILDISGIKECAWIRESPDKESDDKINNFEPKGTSETSKTINEVSCNKNNQADYDQKKKHSRNSSIANCHKSASNIELTQHSINYYLERRKEQRSKMFYDKLSKDDDTTLADFLEQASLNNVHEYNHKSGVPQIVIAEPRTISEESREIHNSNDTTNFDYAEFINIPLDKTYVVKRDDGSETSSHYAKLPFIDSFCNEISEMDTTKNISILMEKMGVEDYKIDTDSKYLEISINDSPDMTTSNSFPTDTQFRSMLQDAFPIQTAPVMQNASNVFSFAPPVLKNTPSHIYKGESLHHPAVKNIKYSLKRPSSRELSLKTTRLPIPISGLTKESGSFEDDLQNSSSKSDPQSVLYSLEYLEDIITHLLAREREMSTLPNDPLKYDITEINRSIIVNWLIKLNTHLHDGLELLEAGVRLFDRCISRAPTPLKDLQLLSTACYWLAQKLVGIGPPRTAGTMARRCGGAFYAADLLRGERRALRLLAWPSPPVLAETFAQYVLKVSKPKRPQVALSIARYLLMAAMLHTRLAALPASRLAPAAVAAALRVCGHDDWPAFWTCRLCNSVEDIISLEKELLEVASVIRGPDCLCREPYYLFCQTRHHAAALRVTVALDRSVSNDSYFSTK